MLSPLLQTCAVLFLLIHCIGVRDDEHPPSVNDIEHLSKDSETSPVDEANSDKEITALTESNRREISSAVKVYAERVVYDLEHPPPKISIWLKIRNSFKKSKKESESDNEI